MRARRPPHDPGPDAAPGRDAGRGHLPRRGRDDARGAASVALRAARRLVDSLSGCLGCGSSGPEDDGVCRRCWDAVALPVDSGDLLALGRYRRPLDAILRAGKFGGGVRALDRLGGLLGERLLRAGLDRLPIVPVPRHPRRVRRYGVDAALRLAEATGGRVVVALTRGGPARPQSRTARSRREGAVRGAFRATAGAAGLRGREVVLVDDVVTTGATARACREALAAAGVRVARLAVVAAA